MRRNKQATPLTSLQQQQLLQILKGTCGMLLLARTPWGTREMLRGNLKPPWGRMRRTQGRPLMSETQSSLRCYILSNIFPGRPGLVPYSRINLH